MLVVPADSPIQTVQDLVARARAQPGALNYGSGGNGSPAHLVAEAFCQASGTKMTHVPFKGPAEAVSALLGNQISAMFATVPAAAALARGGKLRAIAVTSPQRLAALPQVPTLAEAGVRGFEMSTWYALYVTAGTPPDVQRRLQTELARVLQLPDVQTRLRALGGEPGGMSTEQFAQYNRQEFDNFGQLIKRANIKME